jgi:HSF-type DNA-binding
VLPWKERGGAKGTFPLTLYGLLQSVNESGEDEIVHWLPHGRAFLVVNKKRFVKEVLPKYFHCQQHYTSFQRQLNIYGFLRLTKAGPDQNAYYNELFIRGRPDLCPFIIPKPRISDVRSSRKSIDPHTAPDFYKLPWASNPFGTLSFISMPSNMVPNGSIPADARGELADTIKPLSRARSEFNVSRAYEPSSARCSCGAAPVNIAWQSGGTDVSQRTKNLPPSYPQAVLDGLKHVTDSSMPSGNTSNTNYYQTVTRPLPSCFVKEDEDLMNELFAAEDCLPGSQQLPSVEASSSTLSSEFTETYVTSTDDSDTHGGWLPFLPLGNLSFYRDEAYFFGDLE